MSMFKKLTALFLVAIITFCFTGCNPFLQISEGISEDITKGYPYKYTFTYNGTHSINIHILTQDNAILVDGDTILLHNNKILLEISDDIQNENNEWMYITNAQQGKYTICCMKEAELITVIEWMGEGELTNETVQSWTMNGVVYQYPSY